MDCHRKPRKVKDFQGDWGHSSQPQNAPNAHKGSFCSDQSHKLTPTVTQPDVPTVTQVETQTESNLQSYIRTQHCAEITLLLLHFPFETEVTDGSATERLNVETDSWN